VEKGEGPNRLYRRDVVKHGAYTGVPRVGRLHTVQYKQKSEWAEVTLVWTN
jgi:hypothetical protein